MSILADILSSGHIDQELLNALDEEQKAMLFIQMRAEQVRKWEAFERACDARGPPKRDMTKRRIRWLTGQDGDVWTWVMGDHRDDPSIDDILDHEAREEARMRARMEQSPEERLKAQLGALRVGAGATDSFYEDADQFFDPHHTPLLLLQPHQHTTKSALSPKSLAYMAKQKAEAEAASAGPQLLTTTVSSYSTPVPQKAVVGGGEKPPAPTRPAQLPPPAPIQNGNMQDGQTWQEQLAANGVRLRAKTDKSEEAGGVDMNKRESEIFQSIQERRERIRREAEAEAERQRIEWEQQEARSREAEAAIREIAQKAREQHRQQQLRTSTSILPALADTNATSLREAIKNLPRPPKPKSRGAIVEWFRREEAPRGTGLDPKTRLPAPWFHGIISRDSAEQLLRDKPAGAFLVRVSERIWGYTVSYVVAAGQSKHFLVEKIPEGYQFLGTNQVVHDQLFDLVSYHESAPITAKGGEILKWAVGQVQHPPDYQELLPDAPPQRTMARF